MNRRDVAIVGAGIAGASLAAELAPHARVLLLEAEDRPGYHATGRSAAFWSETNGGPDIQPLTSASGPLLKAGGFLEPLGSLHIGRASERAEIEALLARFERDRLLLAGRGAFPAEALPLVREERAEDRPDVIFSTLRFATGIGVHLFYAIQWWLFIVIAISSIIQLWLQRERQVKPRRANDATRWLIAAASRLFDWRRRWWSGCCRASRALAATAGAAAGAGRPRPPRP